MLTLTATKQHLRVDHDTEDALITALMAAATSTTANYLGITLDGTAPEPVKQAALLLVGDMFENRTAQTERPLYANQTFERLLSTYRVMTA